MKGTQTKSSHACRESWMGDVWENPKDSDTKDRDGSALAPSTTPESVDAMYRDSTRKKKR